MCLCNQSKVVGHLEELESALYGGRGKDERGRWRGQEKDHKKVWRLSHVGAGVNQSPLKKQQVL